jgi:hypothetical protein
VRPRRVPNAGASVPMELGHVTLLACMNSVHLCQPQCGQLSRSSLNAVLWVFMETSSHRYDC